MRPEYIGVKYYSSNDMSIGYNFDQARKLLDIRSFMMWIGLKTIWTTRLY